MTKLPTTMLPLQGDFTYKGIHFKSCGLTAYLFRSEQPICHNYVLLQPRHGYWHVAWCDIEITGPGPEEALQSLVDFLESAVNTFKQLEANTTTERT
jgi:hypothetical protein